MGEPWIARRGRGRKRPRSRTLRAAFAQASAGAAPIAYPGFPGLDSAHSKRSLVTGSISALFHLGLLAILVFFASMAAVIEDNVIPVQLLPYTPEPPKEPAPAPKVLAERRALPFAPQLQTAVPQIVNPRIVAEAAPQLQAEALDMDAVNTVSAPKQIERVATVVERVSSVNSAARAQASSVDVAKTGIPTVRGPIRADAPVGPSVGPRQVRASTSAPTAGTGTLEIGPGSSVREGVLSNRDVQGSPSGVRVVSIDTAIGDGYLSGRGGRGDGPGNASQSACMHRPEVRGYLEEVHDRTVARWVLPPGLASNNKVTLRFRLDAAGSASEVSLVKATDNALGASAVDALRAASPFTAMAEAVRCLSQLHIVATFSNPVAG